MIKWTEYLVIIAAIPLFLFSTCKKPPAILHYYNVKGYVIAKEICHTDPSKDYWLIDLTFLPDTPQYGDTLLLSGVTFTNVVKTKELSEDLKEIGKRVSIDFKTITPNKVQTTGCSVTKPVTYDLKELFIIHQFEIL